MTEFPYDAIEEKIGYVFKDKALLMTAFTHSSFVNGRKEEDNERMEYLGDSVLQLVVTQWQYLRMDGASEGKLTRERQKIVCEDALYDAVRDLDIWKYVRVNGGKENIGKKTVSSLFESLTAAIYLDGGYEKAQEFILKHGLVQEIAELKNPKGELQEWLQRRGEPLPEYSLKKRGKDNDPTFLCEARALGVTGFGKGKSKRLAEQEAALELLNLLQDREDAFLLNEQKKNENKKRKK